jgi:hypothetical protein
MAKAHLRFWSPLSRKQPRAAVGAKRSFGDRMKSTVADSSIQVRWGSGYWVSEAGVIPQPSSDTIGPATDTTGVAGAIGKAGTSVSPGN